jgi:hypothetical protein
MLLCVPCRRCTSPVGEIPTRPLSLRPEALGAGQEATNGLKHFKKSPLQGGQRSVRAVTRVNIVQAPKRSPRKPTRHNNEEGRRGWASERDTHPAVPPG